MSEWIKVFPSQAGIRFVSVVDADSPTGFSLVEETDAEVKSALGIPSTLKFVVGNVYYDSGAPEGNLDFVHNDFLTPTDWTVLSGNQVVIKYTQGTFNSSNSVDPLQLVPLKEVHARDLSIRYDWGDNGTYSYIYITFTDTTNLNASFPDGDTVRFGFMIIDKNSTYSSFKESF